MAKLIGIVGASGTGKTTSFRDLPEKETFMLMVKNKPLPFRGWKKRFILGENLKVSNDWKEIALTIKEVDKTPRIKTLIIDDVGYLMTDEFMKRSDEGGFERFTDIAKHMFLVLETALNCRDDLNIIFTFHEEKLVGADGTAHRSIRTIGKLLNEKYTIEGIFTVLFYSTVEYDINGNPEYKFATNRTKDLPAKSPMGMFEELYIDNNMNEILEVMNAYYRGE